MAEKEKTPEQAALEKVKQQNQELEKQNLQLKADNVMLKAQLAKDIKTVYPMNDNKKLITALNADLQDAAVVIAGLRGKK